MDNNTLLQFFNSIDWIFCAVILIGGRYWGSKYYVSPTGNDNAAGTLAAPFKTLEKGSSILKAGDTLILRGGTTTGVGRKAVKYFVKKADGLLYDDKNVKLDIVMYKQGTEWKSLLK